MMETLKELIKNNRIADAKLYQQNGQRLLARNFLFEHPFDMEPCGTTYHLDSWHRSPNNDPEWLYMLKRQEYLQDFIFNYYQTDDNRYLMAIKDYINEWILQNYVDEQVRYHSWRTIDTGIRLLNWAPAVRLLIQENQLTQIEIDQWSAIVNEQAQYLKDHYISKYDLSNWGILITTGILVYDAINSDRIDESLVTWAMDSLACEMNLQVDSEGMHWEQSPLYFIEVFRSVLCVLTAYQSNQLQFPKQIIQQLKQMLKALHYFVLPSGYLLQQGDTDAIRIDGLYQTASWLLLGQKEVKTYDLLLLEMTVNQPIAEIAMDLPAKLSAYFDAISSGNYFYQAVEFANYWHFYNGRLGSGHGHAALNHLDLTIEGQNVLVDPGRYTYVESDERTRLKSAESHNTVMIDGHFPTVVKDSWKFSQVADTCGVRIVHHELYDVLQSHYTSHQLNENCYRYCIWLKAHAIMVIVDINDAPGQHDKQNNWILSPDLQVTQMPSKIRLSGRNKVIDFYTSDELVSVQDQLYSERYNDLQKTHKIQTNQQFKNDAVSYTVIGNADKIATVELATVEQSNSSQPVEPQYCYGVNIQLMNDVQYTIGIQHVNTIIGDKLYDVDGHKMYGTVSIAKQNEVINLL